MGGLRRRPTLARGYPPHTHVANTPLIAFSDSFLVSLAMVTLFAFGRSLPRS